MDFSHGSRSLDLQARVAEFLRAYVEPVEARLLQARRAARRGGDWTAWCVEPETEALKAQAREAGLWNLFLPDPAYGADLLNVEYAPLAAMFASARVLRLADGSDAVHRGVIAQREIGRRAKAGKGASGDAA